MVPGLRLHMAVTLAVLVLVALGLAAGCGDDEEEATPTATPTVAADQTEFEVTMEEDVAEPEGISDDWVPVEIEVLAELLLDRTFSAPFDKQCGLVHTE